MSFVTRTGHQFLSPIPEYPLSLLSSFDNYLIDGKQLRNVYGEVKCTVRRLSNA